jgi:hypothetical protein
MNDAPFPKFVPAVRLNTPMIIGVSGPSGSGKTYTALTLAQGLAGDGKIAFVDTEGRRGLQYADYFKFDHLDMPAPYSPRRFLQALQYAEKEGYAVIIVDSFSDEYVGQGGLVDMADAELARVKNSAASWAKPKAEHKLITRWLRQCRVHVIMCLRAEEKVRLEKVMKDGREQTVVTPIGWVSVCEKNVPYEMILSFLLTPDKPGYPQPIKLQNHHKDFFPLDKPVGKQTGIELAAWCVGGAPQPAYDDFADPLQPPLALEYEGTEPQYGPDDIPDFPHIDALADRLAQGVSPAQLAREREEHHRGVLISLATESAANGTQALKMYCDNLTREERASIKKVVVEELLPHARQVDADRTQAYVDANR